MEPNKKKKFFARLTFSIGVLIFVTAKINFDQFWISLTHLHWVWLILNVILFFPAYLLGTYRWYFILKEVERPFPFLVILQHETLGKYFALFLPGQITGDLVKTISLLSDQEKRSEIVYSVLVDKGMFFVTLLISACLGIYYSQTLIAIQPLLILVLFFSAFGIFILWMITRVRHSLLINWFNWAIEYIPKPINKFLQPTGFIGSWPRLSYGGIFINFSLGFALQGLNAIGNYSIGRSFDIKLSILEWLAISAVISILQLIPITIAGLGLREGAFVSLLGLFGVSAETAFALSITKFTFVIFLTVVMMILVTLISSDKFSRVKSYLLEQGGL